MADPIQADQREMMNFLAETLDQAFNGVAPGLPGLPRSQKKTVGFVLLTANFGKIEGGRVNYISNGEREDMIAMMRECLARLEGQPMTPGRA